jgi:hypothetical protein
MFPLQMQSSGKATSKEHIQNLHSLLQRMSRTSLAQYPTGLAWETFAADLLQNRKAHSPNSPALNITPLNMHDSNECKLLQAMLPYLSTSLHPSLLDPRLNGYHGNYSQDPSANGMHSTGTANMPPKVKAECSVPLLCSLCPKSPNFSDISHLLTHISSKSHLAIHFKLKIRSQGEQDAKGKLDNYEQWYSDNNLDSLLSDRLSTKDQKKRNEKKARLSNASKSAVSIIHTRSQSGSEDNVANCIICIG